MPALIVATDYLPIPAGTESFTLRDDDVLYSLAGVLSFSFYERSISVARTYRNRIKASDFGDSVVKRANIGATTNTTPDSLLTEVTAKDDAYNATAPRDEAVKVSYMIFWSGATGSGNVIAMCPASLFEQFSPATPTRF